MADATPQDHRKPWILPAISGALEPDDIANSYQTTPDSNPHAVNDHNAS